MEFICYEWMNLFSAECNPLVHLAWFFSSDWKQHATALIFPSVQLEISCCS